MRVRRSYATTTLVALLVASLVSCSEERVQEGIETASTASTTAPVITEPPATTAPSSIVTTVAPTTTTAAAATTTTAVATTAAAATTTTAAATTTVPVGDPNTVVGRLGGAEWFMGQLPVQARGADPDLDPIRVGLLNQENSPAGSFPEARAAVEAAVRWVNEELGGVNGRPVELEVCVTDFTVERSQACAQQMVMADVVAVTTGIDIGSTGAIPIFEQNGIPVVGGIPTNMAEMESPSAFYFSGAMAGAYAGFIGHAIEHFGASRIVLAHGEFESFTVSTRDYGAALAEALGLEVKLIPFPLFTFDFLPVLTKAAEFEPDAIVVAAADLSCAPIMQTMVDLGIEAQLYLVGSCAAEEILEVAGSAAETVLFNSESPLEATVDGAVYEEVVAQYASEPAGGVGTVSMRGFLNLYALLIELGPDAGSREALLDLIRSAVDRPSFWGHPYTCDKQQIPGLPALCAPQQAIFSIVEGEVVPADDGWIDTPALFAQLG